MAPRTWLLSLPSLLLAGAAGALAAGCDAVECGDGTVERNGVCEKADGTVNNAVCGPFTYLDQATGMCRPEYDPTVCEEDTTEEDVTEIPGVILCRGTGGGGCDAELSCPSADTGRMSVCGRLHDVETDDQIRGVDAIGTDCLDPEAVQEGPCQLDVRFYNALDYAVSPGTATPLAVDEFRLDDCGRFRARNINYAGASFMGIGVEDKVGAPQLHRRTGVAFGVVNRQTRGRTRAYLVRRSTDQAWSEVAYGAGQMTFVDRGVFMTVFEYPTGQPREGVTITNQGSPTPSFDWYFTDTAPLQRSLLAPSSQAVTGPNGAGLITDVGGVNNLSGTGGNLPSGCTWDSALGASVAGLLFFSPRHASMGGNPCP
jgi:hypothetical protein